VIPETFGLVFAESHALGTPVLTADCGAALEILGDREQVTPVTTAQRVYESTLRKVPVNWREGPARVAERLGLFDRYIERISAWRAGARPHAGPDPRFRLSTVARRWRALIESGG